MVQRIFTTFYTYAYYGTSTSNGVGFGVEEVLLFD